MVSVKFPKSHKRSGEKTNFETDILTLKKAHTIRSNFELWEKRFAEIEKGNAVLSVRYWADKAYRSKQIEIIQFNKESGIGIQKIRISKCKITNILTGLVNDRRIVPAYNLSKNDGLSLGDFEDWFKNYDLSGPMVIIHFSPMRY